MLQRLSHPGAPEIADKVNAKLKVKNYNQFCIASDLEGKRSKTIGSREEDQLG